MKKLLWIFFLAMGTVAQAQNSPAPIKLVDVILSPSHADWNYKTGEKAEVGIQVLQYGVPVPHVEITYEYGPEMLKAETKEKMVLKDGTGAINIGTAKKPGFRQLKVSAKVAGKVYKSQVKLGFSPEQIEPTNGNPADFDAFWEEAVAEARQSDFDAHLRYLPEYSTDKVDTYLLNLNGGNGKKRVYGYLCKPKADGKYPVLFAPPGAGVKPVKPYTGFAEDGFISLSIEIHGIDPMLEKDSYKQISNAFGDYMRSNLDRRDDYYYKAVYQACVRCVDYLTTLPEFDGRNVFVTGGSQGGALSIVTTALNEKVTALVAFYPALCDLSGYARGRSGGWPHLFRDEESLTEQRLETTAYFDVVNFARRIQVPGFYSWGYNDNTCCPTSVYSAYNVIEAPKEKQITPISGHWRFGETNANSLDFLKKQMK